MPAGGFSGEGIKTIIPSKAVVKIAARLVADQDPDEILKLIEAHVEAHRPPACNVTLRPLGFKGAAYVMKRGGRVNAAAAKVGSVRGCARACVGWLAGYPRVCRIGSCGGGLCPWLCACGRRG